MPQSVRNIQGGTTADDFWTQYSSINPRMALFVKVVPKAQYQGVYPAKGFTTNTRNMTLPGHAGVTFNAAPSISPTIIEQLLDNPASAEFTGFYSDDSFSRTEILQGVWNFAYFEVFVRSWDQANNLDDLGEAVFLSGYLGEFKDSEKYFTAEVRGKSSRLSQDTGIVTQKLCRALHDGGFRGSLCGHTDDFVTIDGTAYEVSQTLEVSAVNTDHEIVFAQSIFSANPDVPDEFFAPNGKINAVSTTNFSGNNEVREIAKSVTGSGIITVTLRRPFSFDLTVGDQFTLVAGCNGTVEDCMKFTNIQNRRAEDYIPGVEAANRIPSAR